MMMSSNGNIFRVTGHLSVPGEFPAQRPVTRSFNVFFGLRLNKRLSKQSWGWWFETLSRSLWRHCNDYRSTNSTIYDDLALCTTRPSEGVILTFVNFQTGATVLFVYVTSNRYTLSQSLQWHHNVHGGVSNHRRLHCLLNCWFRRRSKKTSKLRVTGLYVGNSPVTGELPTKRASNAEKCSLWWRHQSVGVCSSNDGFVVTVISHVTENEDKRAWQKATYRFEGVIYRSWLYNNYITWIINYVHCSRFVVL